MALSIGLLGGAAAAYPLEWFVSNLGSGYGSRTEGSTGATYAQTYGTLYKLKKDGKLSWARQLSGSGNKQGLDLDASGNVYIAGGSGLVAKFDTNGNLLWQRTVGSVGWQALTVNQSTSEVYVGGAGSVAKLDSTGSIQWSRVFTASGITLSDITGISVANSLGHVSISGHYNDGTTFQGVHINIDSNGNIRYGKRLTKSGQYTFLMGCDTRQSDGTTVVAGFNETRACIAFAFDVNGNFLWSSEDTTGGYIYTDYGTPTWDASGYWYLGAYQYYTNFGVTGRVVRRFSGSVSQGSRSLTGTAASGGLRLSASRSDRTLTYMGTDGVWKLDGSFSTPAGTYDGYLLEDNPAGVYTMTSGTSQASFSYGSSNPNYTSVASSYGVVVASLTPTVNYLA